jgi:MoaA/NifB/PqqE/SkfB family radical SAM enzyme
MKAQESNLNESLRSPQEETHIERRLKAFHGDSVRVLVPPFPRQIQVETTNLCNHACPFCEYSFMERPKRKMNDDLFRRVVKEAFDLGAREIGVFSGAEPLMCKSLESHIVYCTELGYEYIYITTNGAVADTARWKRLLDAGLRSIKFSINGGTREIYRAIHGHDDFDKVIANLRFVSE